MMLAVAAFASRLNGEELLRLDPFVVTAARYDSEWQYCITDEFEVLTACSADLTREVLAGLRRGNTLIPASLLVKRSEPMTVILFRDQPRNSALAPNPVRFHPGNERLSLRARTTPGSQTRSDRDSLIYAINFSALTGTWEVDTTYVGYRFLENIPQPPRWLKEGLFGDRGILSEVVFIKQTDRAKLPAPDTSSMHDNPGDRRLKSIDLIPLRKFFNDTVADENAPTPPEIRFVAQAAIFCRWALWGRKAAKETEAQFWRYAKLSSVGSVQEDVFQACFGLTFPDAEREIIDYIKKSGSQEIFFPIADPDRKGKAIRLNLRRATQGEIARILGNWQMQAAQKDERADVNETLPSAIGPIIRAAKASDDPKLNSLLGLLYFQSGDVASALPLLANSDQRGGTTTRAKLALADILYRQAVVPPNSPQLDRDTTVAVLTILASAHARRPVVVETYKAIARVWNSTILRASYADLTVLEEGIRLFPHDEELRRVSMCAFETHGIRPKSELIPPASSDSD